MESINNFSKGLNKDTNNLQQPEGSYKDAYNVRLITDSESTSLSINNMVGNELTVSIPDSPLIQKIAIVSSATLQNVTIDGETGSTTVNTAGWTGSDLYDFITTDVNFTKCNQNPAVGSKTYSIYYNSNYIIVVPLNYTSTIWISTTPSFKLYNSYVPAQTDLEVIGSCTIRDDMYLFTTNNKTKNPGGHSNDSSLATDPSSVGVIWKLTYDKVTLSSIISLVYANYMDFSTYYAIAPSACLGRYENSATQRLYWTDNFNTLRSINVADPNILALDISILNIIPAVDFDIPKLMKMSSSGSNNLKAGVIQCAYRLKNNGGAVTTFSPLSNIVTLVVNSESGEVGGGGFRTYIGANINTVLSKAITWQIDNLDRDFNRIEVVILFRESLTASPVIEALPEDNITSDSYTVIYDGSQNTIPLTLEEFLALSGTFTHCKTIETKDNRLFAANIRNQQSDLSYDARAYRFPSGSNTLTITENGAPTSYNTASWTATGTYPIIGWTSIAEDSDAINANQTTNKYKKNSTTIGGTGPNISYEFFTMATAVDKDTGTAAGLGPFGNYDYQTSPWRSTNPRYFGANEINLNVNSVDNNGNQVLQEFPPAFPNINDGLKYPHINGLLKGYQRNEIYRFAIQFFDKSGNPFFAKWIGDIQFPDYRDTNANSLYEDGSSTGITDFRPSFTANKNGTYAEAFTQQIGIKFNVSIPDTIQDLVGGYQIVRVDRTIDDMSIVCEGYCNPADYADFAWGDQNFYMTSLSASIDGNLRYYTAAPIEDKGFFITPNINDPNLPVPTQGMNFKIKGVMVPANSKTSMQTSPGGDPYYQFKQYTWNTSLPATTSFVIQQISRLGYNNQGTDLSTGKLVSNFDFDFPGTTTNRGYSMGNGTYYFRLDTYVDYDFLIAITTGAKYLISIDRTLTNQYGGNTYSARANNEYIACSMYRPYRSIVGPQSDNILVFGGDTYVNMYDSCAWAKNWGSARPVPASNHKYSATFIHPVSSPINTDLRHGNYMNKDFIGGFNYEYSGGATFIETYVYNPVYSANDVIKKYYPKPDPFNLNEEYDTRFHASEIKINGEETDSWGIFLPNNYWDVEGIYGPINAISVLNDKMYYWQNRAFGTMSINPRVMVTDTGNDAEIQLGTGNVLQRHDYITIDSGLQHQWGMTKSPNKLYWVDINKKKFLTFNGQFTPESDVKGMLSWFNTYLTKNINKIDKPVYEDSIKGLNGIRCVYDYKYNQAIFTFSDASNTEDQSNYTLVYDDFIDAFSTFLDATPKVYITDYSRIFSTNPSSLSDIFMHDHGDYGRFYNTIFPATVKLIVNPNPTITKVFDNISYDSQSLEYSSTYDNYQNQFNDTWNTIRIYNDYQNTDFQTLVLNSNLKRRERSWNIQIPRNRVLYTGGSSPNIFNPAQLSQKTIGERLRDKYIAIDLTYNNSSNRLLTCNNFKTTYRGSAR